MISKGKLVKNSKRCFRMLNTDNNTLETNVAKESNQIFDLFAPCDGLFIFLDQVKNLTYAQKALGEGFAIEPASHRIYTPVNGNIAEILDTKHALIIEHQGNNILLHMGIDTVSLNGAPFQIHVNKGQEVTNNILLAEMDIVQVEESGRIPSVIVVVLNDSEQMVKIDFLVKGDQVPVKAGKKIATVQLS